MHKMIIAIYYSSRTGNTRKVANGIFSSLSRTNHTVSIEDSEKTDQPVDADVYIICFWCDKGSLDKVSMNITYKLHNKKIIVVGTMGAMPSGLYAQRVDRRVTEFVSVHNHVLGTFLCQGKIPEAVTERRRSLPVDDPHYLNDRRYASHLESRKHPDQKDIDNANIFVNKLIQKIM